MLGVDIIGAEEDAGIDAAAQGVKAIVKYVKKDDKKPADLPKPPKPEHSADDGIFETTIAGPVKVWHALLGVAVAIGAWFVWPKRK